MGKPGIATKLFLAFGGIFLLAFIAALIGWQGFARIANTQNVVIDQAIPGLRRAHELAEINALIGSASLSLARASSEQERQEISTTLFSQVKALEALLDEFQAQGFAEQQLDTLRRTIQDIAQNLRQQSELVRQRLKQESRIERLASELLKTTDELNELADSLVANAAATTTAITSNLYDLVEGDASKEQLYDVFDRLVEVDIDAMERMYELRLRSSNLRALINQVVRESNADRLTDLRQRSVATLSILKRRVDEINDPQRKRQADTLLGEMELSSGPLYVYGIFESKLALLSINEDLQQLIEANDQSSRRLDRIVVALTQAGGSLISRVSVTARESLESSRILFNWSAIVSLLIAALILWGYVKRNVIRRLLSLELATRSIAGGHYDVEIDSSGADEVSKMAAALQVFRDNAIEKRRVDEELLEYKTHLEHLVSLRTTELEKTNSRLSDVARQHADARDEAEKANRAKTEFLATMSHELRTPLSGALGILRLLEDTQLTRRQRQYVHTIDSANATLLNILNDILGYSQMDAGKITLENRPFKLQSMLQDIGGLMSVPARDKGNRIVCEFTFESPPLLYGDSGKLHQILLNLIGNAVKFTDHGVITLRAKSEPGKSHDLQRLFFEVQDTGIGIQADKHKDVFRAFTQVDSTTARQQGGVGLGLAICERLVDALGGAIHLTSEPNKGTSINFSIEMPIASAPELQDDQNGQLHTPPRHVLVVEDDPTNRMITSRYLEKLGHRYSTAVDGKHALEKLNTESIDLVLLDIGLPGMDGLTILKQIRKHDISRIRELPVIAMSAHVFQEEVDAYMNAGMNGFLGKPFSLKELAISVGRMAPDVDPVVFQDPTVNDALVDRSVILEDIARLGAHQVKAMLDLFNTTATGFLEEIEVQLVQHNSKALADIAHKFRGAAGNFGLQKLCARLLDIELTANNGKMGLKETPDDLAEILEHSLFELEAVLEQHDGSRASSAAVNH